MAFLWSLPGRIRKKIYGVTSGSASEASGPNRQPASDEKISGVRSGSDEIKGQRSSASEVSGPNSQLASDEIKGQRSSDSEVSGPNSQSASDEKISGVRSGSDEIPGQRSSARDVSGPNSQSASESENEFEVNNDDPKQPGIIQCPQIQANSVNILWEEPRCIENEVQYYELKYKIIGEKRWSTINTPTNSTFFIVNGLKSNTSYEFKVRAIFDDDDEGPFSEICGDIKTQTSLSETIIHEDWIVKHGQPATYKLPLTVLQETINQKAKSRKCIFGNLPRDHKKEKTIMVVGATGSGKSTLINGMVNYILGVEWEDKSRFTIIDLTDEEKGKKDESVSQTEWITCYTVPTCPGSHIKYTLNIIDTPGFGDTRGIKRDQEIVDQIRELFTTPPPQGIQTLDAVCFVAQAPLARLTLHQRYIFDSVLSIFGNDISKNIFVLITFADGNEPPVKMALEAAQVPFQKTFKFNNSALFVSTESKDDAQIGQMFWKMGKESFNVFFTELTKTNTQSLQLTADVLKTRQRLEVTIQGLQPQIHEGLSVINTIKQEKQVIDKHKADILANKKFEYEVEEIKEKLVPLELGTYVTNCLTCNKTCHYPCSFADDELKRLCVAMDTNGYCTVCPKHCFWESHKNTQHRYEFFPVKVKRTSDELKKNYDIALDEEKKHSHILQKMKAQFNKVGQSVFAMIKRVRDCINDLNQKAIKQNPLSQVEYIELLIESEKSEAKYGWQQRVEMFQSFKKQAELMKDIPNQEFKPWTDEDVEALLNDKVDYKR